MECVWSFTAHKKVQDRNRTKYIYKLVGLLLSHSLTVSSSFICSITNAACVRVLSNVCARHVLYWDIVVHDIPCNGFTTAK